jgi:DNA-binding NarL/FixJ family response regulator
VIRVLIVDDQVLVRTGLRTILEEAEGFAVAGEAADGYQALECARALRPDVVLMDVRMPRMDGIDATRHLADLPDPPKVVILTTYDLDEYVYAALAGGASGFLLKDALAAELLTGLRVAVAGDAVIAPSATRRLIDQVLAGHPHRRRDVSVLEPLTQREREVLVHVARGLTNTEIAAALYLSEGTVKTHLARILHKLDLRDRIQAVILAYETGLVQPGG